MWPIASLAANCLMRGGRSPSQMRPIHVLLVGLSLLGELPAGPLRAQVCAAFPSLRQSRFRATGGVESYRYATKLAVSATSGRTLFGTIGVGRTRDGELDASTFDIRLETGADIADHERQLFLCPVVAVSVSLGPNDFLLEQNDYRYVDRAIGLGVAAVAVQSSRIAVLVAGGVRAARLTVTYLPSAEKRSSGSLGQSQSDNYWLAGLAVGIVVKGVVAIRPSVSVPFGFPGEPSALAVPFGREEGEISLGIGVAIVFGGRNRGIR